jgi:iron complex outermembrane recepter protein
MAEGLRTRVALCAGVATAALVMGGAAVAQTPAPVGTPVTGTASVEQAADAQAAREDDGIGDIVVTAQKRGVAERAQDVPVAITAYNAAALQQAQLRNLPTLAASAPNVALEDGGTVRGTANFSIRGFGVVGTVPSMEPSVGVFVNGVYQGISAGSVGDLYDIESIEILRGPQGTLFGRNTTGGAVTIRTVRPTEKFEVAAKASVESGPLYTFAGAVSGPIAGDSLLLRVTGYYAKDEGWFDNIFYDRPAGTDRTWFVRPTLVWQPSANFDNTTVYEHSNSDGGETPIRNPLSADGFKLNYNFLGYHHNRSDSVTNESNLRVGFGDGTITNVFGWKDYETRYALDVDGQPLSGFHGRAGIKQHQFSDELRYAGTFGRLEATAGVFYFYQFLNYVEYRYLAEGASIGSLGGKVNQHSAAAFAQLQYNLTDNWALIVGGRYSWEKKDAVVAPFSRSLPCNVDTFECVYAFPSAFPGAKDPDTWSSVTPKLGFQYQNDAKNILVYANWSQGIRSGGYNVKSTAPTVPPGPYGQERQDAFELGWKTDLLDRHVRLNGAVFYNRLRNLQRDINTPDPVGGVVQITNNVGTARVLGAEGELLVAPVRGVKLGASFGYLDGKYLRLTADLNGALPGLGEDLQIVRLPKWTYAFNATYDAALNDATTLSLHAEFQHRDRTFFTDNNLGPLLPVNFLNGNIALGLDHDRYSISLYGRNLLNRLSDTGYTPLPASTGGGAYQTINKGRVIGIELAARFR